MGPGLGELELFAPDDGGGAELVESQLELLEDAPGPELLTYINKSSVTPYCDIMRLMTTSNQHNKKRNCKVCGCVAW
jgi:hypothetical protein